MTVPFFRGGEGPEYPRELGPTVAKFRRKASHAGSISEMLPADRRAYGEAVERAILTKQRQSLQRELPGHKINCSSGTAYTDGADIEAAIRAQHRAALQASVQRDRRERKPEQWQYLYEQAMKDKAERRARHSGGPNMEGEMGTRSMTIVMDGNDELVRIYRQMDGYPEGHGLDLAKLCDLKIVNGIGDYKAKIANGMGCLAAQIIDGLKDGPGHIYIEKCGGEISDWVEYVYIVRGMVDHQPVIDCSTQPGPWPFNIQKDEHFVFAGTGKAWLKKFGKRASAA